MTDPPDSSREPFHIPPRVARRRRRVRRRFGPTFGDLLVQQTRSTIGSDEAQRATIETLGLGKIGRCTAVSLDQPAALSQVHAVRHLVAIAPLSRSAERTLGLRGEVTEIKVNRYDLPDRTGAAVNIGRNDSEHVVVERRGSDEVVAWWTTALPMASVLKALGPERYRHGIVVAQRGQIASRELSVLDLFDEVLAKRRTPAYVRVEGSAETVGVSTPVYPRHVNHRVTYGEVEVRGESLPWSRLEQLIELTGTPGLAEAISSLEPRFVSLLGGAGDRQ